LLVVETLCRGISGQQDGTNVARVTKDDRLLRFESTDFADERRFFSIWTSVKWTSVKPSVKRSGVSAERRKILGIKECGFLPKAATPLLQRSQSAGKIIPRNLH